MGQVKAETDSMNAKLELLAGRARAVHEMKNNDEIKIADQTVAQQVIVNIILKLIYMYVYKDLVFYPYSFPNTNIESVNLKIDII